MLVGGILTETVAPPAVTRKWVNGEGEDSLALVTYQDGRRRTVK
jgi:hypothetical protein